MLNTTKTHTLSKAVLGLIGVAGSLPALAQSTFEACKISLAYSPVAVVVPASTSPVPGLSWLGVGVLAAVLGVVAWRKQGKNGHRALSVALMAGAALLATHGGDSLVQSVRAAAPYELNNASGGTLTDTDVAFAQPSPVLTVTNTTSARLKITSNANANDTGTCAPGTEIAPGATCTTQAACPVVKTLTMATPPTIVCLKRPEDLTWSLLLNDVLYEIYTPVLENAPTFTPAGVPVAVAMTLVPDSPIPTPNADGYILYPDLVAASTGTATFTLTAPQGYGFEENGMLSTTKTVTGVSYSSCSNYIGS